MPFIDAYSQLTPFRSTIVSTYKRYGNSTKPIDPADNSRGHSKREWAKDIVHVVDTLFSTEQTFIAYGHDRGARISYRLALDFPSRVVGAGFLDIVPIVYMWDAMRLERGHAETKKSHHWVSRCCYSH